MSYASAARGFVLAIACVIAATGLAATEAMAQAAGQWKDGQHVYNKICANCHETGVGPVIRGRQDLAVEYYVYVVRHGLRAMPPFRVTDIDPETLEKVAATVHAMPAPGGGK